MSEKRLKIATPSPADKKNGKINGETSGEKTNTLEAKAEFIIKNGLSKKSFSTLSRMSHAELDAIIANRGDEVLEEAPTASTESVKIVLENYINICEAIKEARTGEKIEQNIKNLALKSAPHIATKAPASTINILIIIGGLIALGLVLVDGVIGIKNFKKFIKKDKVTTINTDAKNTNDIKQD